MRGKNRMLAATSVFGACALALGLALSGCAASAGTGRGSGAGSGNTAAPQDLNGTWQLSSGTDAKGAITPEGAVVTLKLNGASSGGHGPCNSFGANASATTTGQLTISVGIHTDMACSDPELNTTEARYFAALDRITAASIATDTLTLTGGGDTLVFSRATG